MANDKEKSENMSNSNFNSRNNRLNAIMEENEKRKGEEREKYKSEKRDKSE